MRSGSRTRRPPPSTRPGPNGSPRRSRSKASAPTPRLIARLDIELKGQGARLAALGKDEKTLVDLLEKLRDVFADIPKQLAGAEPFANRRGQMAWPLSGKLAVGFGALDDSGRPISGVVVATKPAPKCVRSRTAAWPTPTGSRLRPARDPRSRRRLHEPVRLQRKPAQRRLATGSTPAIPSRRPAASGGRKEPSLYFELRLKGKPLDPKGWLKAGP